MSANGTVVPIAPFPGELGDGRRQPPMTTALLPLPADQALEVAPDDGLPAGAPVVRRARPGDELAAAEARRLVADLQQAGCRVRLSGAGHLWITGPGGAGHLSVASTPSSWRRERAKAPAWLRRVTRAGSAA